ncbi:hypothetical protein Poli38472_005549 [Pythium oligandrum]|uniref:Glycoside hydrolase n=1 Tax=Pythium oligandrum TaxID=41045 RepID=A0A8K1CG75_PYTOL|nr:hypothetical protein Poli38472_005549 [Pythium oligandrum]|eukprot:TMW62931.1 hypothetical protein Poli38472_005549 [Pythium oligandrum]
MKLLALLSGLLLGLTVPMVTAATNPIVIKNYKMYDSVTGKYFGVRGVDYYPRANTGTKYDVNNYDFFTDDHEDIWGPDIQYLADLGANAVRLYAVNPSLSHDKFMAALSAKGMYALVDLGANCKNCAITRDAAPTCYPSQLKSRGEMIIGAFAKYDNVLAFSAGNEVNHVVDDPNTNAPCQKKFIRDMRKYIDSCTSMRKIPVGVVLADTNRDANALYYNCRTDTSDTYENAEWYGINVYVHCDGAVTDVSNAAGFNQLLSDFTTYKMNIPVMLTEFGCLSNSFATVNEYEAQRTWLQAGWLHSKKYRAMFNGGFVFEYSTENANSKADAPYPFTKFGGQNYGLGYYSPATCDHDTVKCVYKTMPNYGFLQTQYKATNYDDEPLMSSFVADANKKDFPSCPSGFATLKSITWPADSTASLSCPTIVPTPGTTPAPTTKTPTPGTSTSPSPSSNSGEASIMRTHGVLATFVTSCVTALLVATFL